MSALTTIGRPGHKTAVIASCPTDYFNPRVAREELSIVSGGDPGSAAHLLTHTVVIALAGARMGFIERLRFHHVAAGHTVWWRRHDRAVASRTCFRASK